ncbi:MAG: hypothetical protein PHV82_14860, partial [Victivallaceae bacterium]|nr:hypothetical protein [Victivallaceae bacterium]
MKREFFKTGASKADLQCGFNETDITPTVGTLCSMGVDNYLKEIFDNVYIRTLAFRQGNKLFFL